MTTFSVTQVNTYIKNIFMSEEFLINIKVIGEISNYKIIRGIAYFSLKDNESLLNCILFSAKKFNEINVGDKVVLSGSVSYYVKGGKLTFNANNIEKYGIGDIYNKFIALKKKLGEDGYFDNKHKKPMPDNIKRIGIITSSTGAVIQDIINVSHRRNKGVDLVLYPSKVQGIGAVEEIIQGIKYFDSYGDVDVIVVARGGGSIEDLQPFNNEELAHCVFKSIKPIISAVGHESDFTIIDMVSDMRAPTPSAAAELLTRDVIDQKKQIIDIFERIRYTTNNIISRGVSEINSISSTLVSAINNKHMNSMIELENISGSIDKVNPLNILKKGYSRAYIKDEVIFSINQLKKEDIIEGYLIDGKFKAIIKEIKNK